MKTLLLALSLIMLLALPSSASAKMSNDGRLIADNLLALGEVTTDQLNPQQLARSERLDRSFVQCNNKYYLNNKHLKKKMAKNPRFARSVLRANLLALVHNSYGSQYIGAEDFYRGEAGQLQAMPLTDPVYISARDGIATSTNLLLDSYTKTPLDAKPGCAVLKMIANSKSKVISISQARRLYFKEMGLSNQQVADLKRGLAETVVPIEQGYDLFVGEGATVQEASLYQTFFYERVELLLRESNPVDFLG